MLDPNTWLVDFFRKQLDIAEAKPQMIDSERVARDLDRALRELDARSRDLPEALALAIAALPPALGNIYDRVGDPTLEHLRYEVAQTDEDDRDGMTVLEATARLFWLWRQEARSQREKLWNSPNVVVIR